MILAVDPFPRSSCPSRVTKTTGSNCACCRKTTNTDSTASRCKGTVVSVRPGPEGGRHFDSARLGPPEFGLFAGDAERADALDRRVLAVGDKVGVNAVRQATVDVTEFPPQRLAATEVQWHAAEFAHRLVGPAAVRQILDGSLQAGFESISARASAPAPGTARNRSPETTRRSSGGSPKETLGGFQAIDHVPGQHRRIAAGIVLAAFLELVEKPCRPVLRIDLPTIDVRGHQGFAHQGAIVVNQIGHQAGEYRVGGLVLSCRTPGLRPTWEGED